MIKKFKELKETLKFEKKKYYKNIKWYRILIDKIKKESYTEIWSFQKCLRIEEYFFNNRKESILCYIFYLIYSNKKNRRGIKLGFSIPINVFDKGLIIDHYGSIVVNGYCKVGKNARLHGNNCIGNKGINKINEYPKIGDNLDLGFGAIIIGDVRIADNITIGSNAVVTKSHIENNAVLVGVPAKKIQNKFS